MTRIRLAYVNVFTDVRGKRRYYFRKRGFKKAPLPGLPGSEEFMAAYQAALAQHLDIGERRTKPGIVAGQPAVTAEHFGAVSRVERRQSGSRVAVKAARPAVRSRGHMTWGAEQIAAYRNTHALGSMARLRRP
jgi:hypothetical protein